MEAISASLLTLRLCEKLPSQTYELALRTYSNIAGSMPDC